MKSSIRGFAKARTPDEVMYLATVALVFALRKNRQPEDEIREEVTAGIRQALDANGELTRTFEDGGHRHEFLTAAGVFRQALGRSGYDFANLGVQESILDLVKKQIDVALTEPME